MTKKTNPISRVDYCLCRVTAGPGGARSCQLPPEFLVIGQMVVQGSVKCLHNTQNYKWNYILYFLHALLSIILFPTRG